MGLFNKSKATTKMFVSHISAPKTKGDLFQKKGIDIPSLANVVKKKVTEIAPELIEEGFKLFSSTVAGFTEDYKTETILYKNIDGDETMPIFIPKHITLIRAFFEENSCSDGYGDGDNGCMKLKDKKLHIELDLVQSHDHQNFYFQPTYYYYIGKDNNNKSIDEISIYYAFVEASEDLDDFDDIEFKQVINFKDVNHNQEYSFKLNNNQYDTTFQSPWIHSESHKKGAYTIAIKIEEVRYSKPFAKTLNKIYKKHEDELKKKINQEIKRELLKISK